MGRGLLELTHHSRYGVVAIAFEKRGFCPATSTGLSISISRFFLRRYACQHRNLMSSTMMPRRFIYRFTAVVKYLWPVHCGEVITRPVVYYVPSPSVFSYRSGI